MATRDEMKVEAIERMKMLNMHKNPINEFKRNGKLNLSEQFGALYWLNDKEKEMVRKFEEDNGHLVYHVIKTHTNFGTLYSLMYVSKHDEEWEMDHQDLKDGYCFAYVVNADEPIFSEFGSIGIRPSIGGVVRVA